MPNFYLVAIQGEEWWYFWKFRETFNFFLLFFKLKKKSFNL